jgi:hypothetical protein
MLYKQTGLPNFLSSSRVCAVIRHPGQVRLADASRDPGVFNIFTGFLLSQE